jgi:hypothetical protein
VFWGGPPFILFFFVYDNDVFGSHWVSSPVRLDQPV